jgi:hypothetical protein
MPLPLSSLFPISYSHLISCSPKFRFKLVSHINGKQMQMQRVHRFCFLKGPKGNLLWALGLFLFHMYVYSTLYN